jgi:uncharacterized protein YndB with AHSA1/START domain
MNSQSFTTTLLVDQTPQKVFEAINHVRGWWSEEVEGRTEELNDVFHYRYKDVHQCTIELVEVVPNKKIVWLVLDNHFSFTKDKREWINTKIRFDILEQGNQTQLRFTHIGLVPQHECFEACQQGWTNYINGSLKNLITKGKGQPNPKEGGFNEELTDKLKLKKQ